jgi:hypothetical protein
MMVIATGKRTYFRETVGMEIAATIREENLNWISFGQM